MVSFRSPPFANGRIGEFGPGLSMRIQVHDVDHGSCITVTGPSGDVMMLDCGYSASRPWYPSVAYAGQTIRQFIPQNLDEDHVQDLPGLLKSTSVMGMFSNPTVSATALRAMKPTGMGAGVQQAHDILAPYGAGGIGQWDHDLGGVRWQAFFNHYGLDFTDTNNLSVALFVRWGTFTALFGGDLECAGWERLLRLPAFVARLREVRVYVASHHGRENGKCDALFRYMRPDVVIFSDGPKRHETQETRDWYAARVNGVLDRDKPSTATGPYMRKVMTTRSDGSLDIRVNNLGGYFIGYEKSPPTLDEIIAALIAPKPTLANIFGGFP